MVMLHRAGRVQDGQRTVGFRLKCVVRAPVVEIVAEAGDEQAENFQIRHEAFHLAGFHHRKHGLGHVQCVAPVVILHWTVVLPHAQYPAAQDLQQQGRTKTTLPCHRSYV